MVGSVIGNSLIAALSRLASVALGIVITVIVARYLGVNSFGTYSLLLAWGSLLQAVADGGLYLALSEQIARLPQRETMIVRAAVRLRSLLFVGVFSAGAILLWLIPGLRGQHYLYLVISLGFLCQALSQLYMGIFQKYGLIWRASVGDIVGRLGQLAVVLMGSAALTLTGAVSAFTVSTASALLLHRAFLPSLSRLSRASAEKQTMAALLRQSWPMGVLLLLNMVYFRIDMLLLSYFRDSAEIGVYGFAYRIIETGLFFPAMFGGLLLPRITAALLRQRGEASQWLTEGLRVVAVGVGLLLASILPLSYTLVDWLLPSSFAPAAVLLRILTVALALMCFGNLFGFTGIALHQQRSFLKLAAVLVGLNLGLNLLLIPHYGALAAAWVTVITEAVATGVGAWLVSLHLPYRLPWAVIFKAFSSAALVAVILRQLPSSWPFLNQLFIAVFLYASLIIITRTIPLNQLRLLLSPRPS